jgi:adenosylhomocysteine nucleosidase
MGRIGLIMATELEAAPIMARPEFLHVKELPFPVYEGDGLILVLSGMGKVNAAKATGWMIENMRPRLIVNAGAAGRTGSIGELGELFQMGQVIDGDRWLSRETDCIYEIAPRGTLSVGRLATYEEPVKTESARRAAASFADFVDMEGVAVVQRCQRMHTPVHLVKYISDVKEGDSIVEAILRLRAVACGQILDHLATLL